MKTFAYPLGRNLSGGTGYNRLSEYLSDPESFPSVGIDYMRIGVPTLAPVLTIKCAYCGNMYPKEIAMKFHNCPTCAGGWCE